MKRVVITGLGLLTSIGNNTEDTWNNLINLKSGIKKITHFDTEGLNCKIAGHISHDQNDPFYYDRSIHLDLKDIKRNDRFIQYGIAAAKMAVEDSGLADLNENEKLKIGVSVGSGIGGLESIYEGSLTVVNKGPRKLSPFFIPSSLVNLLSGQISIKYGFKGPNHSVVTACATGAHSIGDAGEMIKRGAANVMVAGGAEAAVCRLGVSGFCAARSLSTSFNDEPEKASRPWDKDRDGFVMGEGAGILVLEEIEHAKKRGAKIYGELIGYGMSGDAYHITAPAEDGDGGYRAMNEALKMAKLSSDDVQYVNAHGTSTMLGDKIELNAINRLFKNNKNIYVSSTKSSIGHLLGAAGSVEAIFSLLALKNSILPATLNLEDPIDSENIKLIAKEPLNQKTNLALSNSFGFGGTLEFQVINESKKLLINNKKENILKIPLGPGIGQCCGGFVEIKLTKHSNFKNAIKDEVFDESEKLDLYIFGAGHIAQSLITKTKFLNFNTFLIDSRENFLKQNNFSHINYLLSTKPWEIVNHLNKKSMYVIVTHSHDFDFKIVNEILKINNFSYLGLIGSDTKRNKFYKRLEQLGHKKQLINQLECPIGSSIGKSKDPEEISFSILARIIEFKNSYIEDIKSSEKQANEF